jgi:REP element-mobilizing transposase RayT
MPRRKRQFIAGEYYHIYNRGTNKNLIFLSDENYRFLLKRVKDAVVKFNITVIAYCLMPNHYHFLLRQNSDLSISDFMQFIFNSYPKAFNVVNNRSGTLFEGPFHDIHIDKEAYLIHLCRYIHRNPIDGKKPLVSNLLEWPYSNYPEWVQQRNGSLIDKTFIQERFDTTIAYQEFVLDYEPSGKLKNELKRYFLD